MILASPARWTYTAACLFLAFCVTQSVSSIASGPYTLTVTTDGSGAVARNPNFAQYPNGSVVTLTATPETDWLFSHWTGDLTGNANPANIEMTSARSVTAHFVPIPVYTVSTVVSGQGTIALNPHGGSYQSNSTVTVTATAAEGWAFASWSGDASGSTTPLSIQVDSNKSITANFAELVTITEPPENVVTNSGSTVRFNVVAQGTGPLHYQWSFKEQPIDGATTATLTIDNVQSRDEGTYTVTVSNLVSNATASATLALTDSGCTGSNVVTVATEEALRNAIEIGGYVQLCFNGTVALTQPMVISKDVALDAGTRAVTISGKNSTRIFHVQTNASLALTNLVLIEGHHRGEDGQERGLPGIGGAIWNHGGTLLLSSCTLSNNSVIGGNGLSTEPLGSGGLGAGAAIFNEFGTVHIVSSTISSNTARGGFGATAGFSSGLSAGAHGGAIASLGGSVSINNSSLERNYCLAPRGGQGSGPAIGGAMHYSNTFGVIANSLIRSNLASGNYFLNSSQSEVSRSTPAFGGAIGTDGGSLEIIGSELSGNLAAGGNGGRQLGALAAGGAIYSEGPVSVIRSSLFANVAKGGAGRKNSSSESTGGANGNGGAWFNASDSFVIESVFFENIAEGGYSVIGVHGTMVGKSIGGAIYNAGALGLTNTTLAVNCAKSHDEDPSGPGNVIGGGIFNDTNGTLNCVNLTVASNKVVAVEGWGGQELGANIANSNGVVTLRNTILAYPNGTNSNVHGPITDGGHNISSDASANFNSGTSFNFTDPRLGPLADNGGPTMTMALLTGSPAIDFGDSNNAPSTDQRGVARPFGDGVDIGAFEFSQSSSPVIAITMSGSESVQLSFQAAAGTSYRIQRSPDLIDWTTLETIPASENPVMITREFSREPSHAFYQVIVD